MWKKGEITVFVSMLLAVLLFFFQVCLQSAEFALLRSETEAALELAEFSTLSEYHREVLERYGLFYLDLGYGFGQEDQAFSEQRIRGFLLENLGEGQVLSVEAKGFSRATDDNGIAYYEQAVSYMKQKTGVSYLEQFAGYEKMSTEAEESVQAYAEADAREQANFDELKRRREEEEEMGTPDPTADMEALKQGSILQLVLKDPGTVSGKKADLTYMPSVRTRLTGSGARGRYEANAVNDAFFHAYLLERFTNAVNFLAEAQEPGSWNDYQVEYIIAGKDSDIANLEAVCKKLLLMREGMNYAYLLTDSGRVAECEALAGAMVGFTMIPGLVEAVKHVLLLGWAFAESVLDVRLLLNGNRVAFWKGGASWRLSLAEALVLGESLAVHDGQEDSQGLCYKEYLGMLLAVTGREKKALKSLDVLEGVIRGIPGCEGFYVDQCTDGFLVNAVISNGREMSAERWFCYEW